MKTAAIVLCAAALIIVLPVAARAANNDDDFGGAYFTAQTPAALGDTVPASDFAVDESVMDAEALSRIEPAAGGDSVFTLPDNPPAVSAPTAPTPDGEHLIAPEEPVVPGMTTPQSPVKPKP